jgi:hypothetical protein
MRSKRLAFFAGVSLLFARMSYLWKLTLNKCDFSQTVCQMIMVILYTLVLVRLINPKNDCFMSDNWNLIKNEVDAYRNYVKNLPERAAAAAPYCFLLTKEEIDRLLALRGNGIPLDGVRIYLAGNEIDGILVPKVYVVAVEKEGPLYNDYNVPKQVSEAGETPEVFGASPDGGGSTGSTVPCPNFCSQQNILNP